MKITEIIFTAVICILLTFGCRQELELELPSSKNYVCKISNRFDLIDIMVNKSGEFLDKNNKPFKIDNQLKKQLETDPEKLMNTAAKIRMDKTTKYKHLDRLKDFLRENNIKGIFYETVSSFVPEQIMLPMEAFTKNHVKKVELKKPPSPDTPPPPPPPFNYIVQSAFVQRDSAFLSSVKIICLSDYKGSVNKLLQEIKNDTTSDDIAVVATVDNEESAQSYIDKLVITKKVYSAFKEKNKGRLAILFLSENDRRLIQWDKEQYCH